MKTKGKNNIMIQTINAMVKEKTICKMLYHEHFAFTQFDYIKDVDKKYSRKEAYKKYVPMVNLMQENGVNFVLDATPIERGRDPILLSKLSKDTGINIICATGFFKDSGDSLNTLKSLSYIVDLEKFMTELFLKEIQEGIGETGCKAGVIKVATSNNKMSELEKSIFISAANAQIKTGVPIITHCENGTMGYEQVKLLRSLGVNPQKIVIGHMSSNHSLKEQRRILDTGVFIGYDQFGIESIKNIPKDDEKIKNILQLLKEGYGNQIVISHDTLYVRSEEKKNGQMRLPNYIFQKIIPELKKNGIDESCIEAMMKDNLIQLFKYEPIKS